MTDGEPHDDPEDDVGHGRRSLARWAAWLGLILAFLLVILPMPGVLEHPDGDLVSAPCGSVVDPIEHPEEEPWLEEGCDEVRAPLRTGAIVLVVLAVGAGAVLRRQDDER